MAGNAELSSPVRPKSFAETLQLRGRSGYAAKLQFLGLSVQNVQELRELERLNFESPWSAQSFHTSLDSVHNFSYAYTAKEQICCYLIAQLVSGDLEIFKLCVPQSLRRVGLGASLTRRVLSLAEENDATVAHLEVRASNIAAISLYRSAGFLPVGSRPGYYRDGEDAVLMQLLLGACGSSAELTKTR